MKGLNITIPKDLNILYSDSTIVTSSEQFKDIVIEFTQSEGPTNNMKPVARIGMSLEMAKSLTRLLEMKVKRNLK